jgi:periplasmic copper chaperone A
LFFKITDRQAIDQNTHVLAQRPLVVQHIGLKPGLGGENLVQHSAHVLTLGQHRWTIDMAAQIGCEMHKGHATKLPRLLALTMPLRKAKPLQMIRRSLLLLPFMAASAHAHSAHIGDIRIGHAWALPALAGQDGQCFIPLLNSGKQTDALVAARSEVCLTIQLRHNVRYDDPPELQFDLAPNKPIAMRPQAVHFRLLGLRKELKAGENFALVLDFLNAGEIELDVHIANSPEE